MKKYTFTLYPVVIFVVFLGFVSIGLKLLNITVSIESQSLDTSSLPVSSSPSVPAVEKAQKLSPALPKVSPALPTPVASSSKSPEPAAVAAGQGDLRVSNPTERPVRLALLARKSSEKSYREPAHWDFAPMEGGSQGLILSLPQGNLTLSKGDILVAFAQDGSRLYWGPYVVGQTPFPTWDSQAAEWQLVLQP